MNRYNGRCHCGAVSLQLDEAPTKAAECNCSLCRRVAALWHYCPKDRLSVSGPLAGYVQGDRTITTWRCVDCGNVTHWTAFDPSYDRVGVNLRMFEPDLWIGLPIQFIDGASY